jgi:hypothetical protein
MKRALLAVLLLATLPLAPRARAETPTAQCTVLEVQATSEKKGVDPKLDRFKTKFAKPPFSGWDTFKLLREQSVSVERQKPASVTLVNGTVTLLLKDKMSVQGGRPRLRFGVDLDSKDGRRTASSVFTFDSGDGILIAGEPYQNGVYVLALSCSSS